MNNDNDCTPPCPKKSSIYTKTGDKGTTRAIGGRRAPKSDPLFDALGWVYTLSSQLGVVTSSLRSYLVDDDRPPHPFETLGTRLTTIQCHLQELNSSLACAKAKRRRHSLDASYVEILESWIDEYDATLPPLKSFILPAGVPPAAQLHLAGAFCRTAERRISNVITEPSVPPYINRLSDFLFVAARYANMACNLPDIPFTAPRQRPAQTNTPQGQ